jgi:exonuclease III
MSSNFNFNIACWNVDGLYQRIDNHRYCKTDYPEFLNELVNVDLLFMLETHCKTSDSPQIPGFKTTFSYRKKLAKANKAAGGICVAIRDKYVNGISVIKKSCSEILWVKMNKKFFGYTNDIYVGAVYVSPPGTSYTARREDIFDICEKDIAEYSKLGECFVCGDFNSRTSTSPDYVNFDNTKHIAYFNNGYKSGYIEDVPINRRNMDKHKVDSYGDRLLDMCKSTGLRILNGRILGDIHGNTTCYSPNGAPSTIDYFAAQVSLLNKVKIFRVHHLTPLSIHCMISATLYRGCINVNTSTIPLVPKYHAYAWSQNDEVNFRKSLCSEECQSMTQNFMKVNVSLNKCDVNNAVNDVNHIFSTAAVGAGLRILGKPYKGKGKKKRNKKWYDRDCKTLYRELKSQGYKLCCDPYNKQLLIKYRCLKKEYKKLLCRKKRQYHSNLIKLLSEAEEKNPNAFWEVYDKFNELEAVHRESPISPSEWLDHFKNLMNKTYSQPDPVFETQICEFIKNNEESIFNELNFKFTENEVNKAIKHLKNGKASGIDSIKAEMLKSGSAHMLKVITKLFNIIFTSSCFPEAWRESCITGIHKKGDSHVAANYRGIAVGSTVCKVFCNVLQNRLVSYIDRKQVISSNQIGYRKKCRTSDHILVLKTIIDKYILKEGRQYLYVCFVDLKSAFDTIWRDAMIYKLLKNGVSGLFLKVLQDMYKEVSFRVKTTQGLTESFKSTVGVKQGCVLSPTLFNIFLYDFPDVFTPDCHPVKLFSEYLSCLLFADDMVIMSETADGLQKCLNSLSMYCEKWRLQVNIAKTKVIIFNRGGHKISKYKFMYNQQIVEVVQNHIYLGVMFNASGSFKQAIHNLNDKAKKSYYSLIKKLPDCSVKLALKMFKIIVEPVLSYSCEAWCPTLLTTLNADNLIDLCDKPEGEKTHLKFVKFILGVKNKSSNHGSRGELGEFPILISQIMLSVNNLIRLTTMPEDSLV